MLILHISNPVPGSRVNSVFFNQSTKKFTIHSEMDQIRVVVDFSDIRMGAFNTHNFKPFESAYLHTVMFPGIAGAGTIIDLTEATS